MAKRRKPTAIVSMQDAANRRQRQPKMTREPDPEPVIPDPPPWLTGKTALYMWHDLAPKLLKAGCLANFDGHAFALCCKCYALLVNSSHKAEGWRQYSAEFRQYCDMFGLTPSSRTKIAVDEQFSRTTGARTREKESKKVG